MEWRGRRLSELDRIVMSDGWHKILDIKHPQNATRQQIVTHYLNRAIPLDLGHFEGWRAHLKVRVAKRKLRQAYHEALDQLDNRQIVLRLPDTDQQGDQLQRNRERWSWLVQLIYSMYRFVSFMALMTFLVFFIWLLWPSTGLRSAPLHSNVTLTRLQILSRYVNIRWADLNNPFCNDNKSKFVFAFVDGNYQDLQQQTIILKTAQKIVSLKFPEDDKSLCWIRMRSRVFRRLESGLRLEVYPSLIMGDLETGVMKRYSSEWTARNLAFFVGHFDYFSPTEMIPWTWWKKSLQDVVQDAIWNRDLDYMKLMIILCLVQEGFIFALLSVMKRLQNLSQG